MPSTFTHDTCLKKVTLALNSTAISVPHNCMTQFLMHNLFNIEEFPKGDYDVHHSFLFSCDLLVMY